MAHSLYPVGFGKPISSSMLSIEEFKELPTPRKLAYFKKHRGIRHGGICSCCNERHGTDEEIARYEEDEKYIDTLKNILDKCEHVE